MLPRPAAAARSVACAIALTVLALFASASCDRARATAGSAPAPAPVAAADVPALAPTDADADAPALGAAGAPTAVPEDIDHSDPAVAAGDVAAKLAAEAADGAGGGGHGEDGPTIAERSAADTGGSALGFEAASGGGGGGGSGGSGGKGGKGGNGGGLNMPQQAGPLQRPQTSPYGSGPVTSVGGSTDPTTTQNQNLAIGDASVIPSAVVTFGRVQITVPITRTVATKPFDPDSTGEGLDLSATFSSTATPDRFIVPGFWDGSAWRIRFAPPVAGTWSASIVAKDARATDRKQVQFTATDAVAPAVPNDGWLRIESAQLRDAGHGVGRPGWFRGVGYNIGWQDEVVGGANALTFAQMQADGINVLSFWLQKPWVASGPRGMLEAGGVGTYNLEAFDFIDGIVESAETAHVRLVPSIWPHGALRDTGHPWGPGDWATNPYHTLSSAADFFTLTDAAGKDTPQWRAQKKLYRYMIARWGSSPAIAAWVALVEANGTTGWSDADRVKAWADAVRDWFALNDPFRRSAEGYPLTFSLTGGRVDTDFGPPPRDPANLLNLLAADSYEKKQDDVAVAAVIGNTYYANWLNGRRLGFVTEFGGQVKQVGTGDSPPYATQPTHLHNGLWAAIGAGATIAPLLWTDTTGFPFLTDPTVAGTTTVGAAMQKEFARVAAFNALALAASFGGKTLQASIVNDSSSTIAGFRAANGVRGVAWVRTVSGADFVGGSTITFPAMTTGTYDVTWFDTDSASTATVAATGSVAGGPATLTLTVPAFATTRKDLAVLVVQQGLPPSSIVRAEPVADAAQTLARR